MSLLLFVLIRVRQSSRGTFGVLCYGDDPFALTLERPWVDNQENLSCIPAGRYRCRRIYSSKFGLTYEVCEVPGRTHILFHAGNTLDDTHGCILVGEEFSGGTLASSRRGFGELMQYLDGVPEFDLVIHAPVLTEPAVHI